jgi:hypothetical protein
VRRGDDHEFDRGALAYVAKQILESGPHDINPATVGICTTREARNG